MANISRAQQRLVYIVTYSRADTQKFPTRRSFADAVVQAWAASGFEIEHWVVSLEAHLNESSERPDEDMNLYHYHMALKLKRRGRWLQVREYLDQEYGIKVNFSDHHNTYYSGYKYVTKEDSNSAHSESHPDLQNPPRTEKAIGAKKRKGTLGTASSQRVRKRRRDKAMSVFDVSQIIQQRKITKRIELVCLAVQQKRAGSTALAEFIANKGENAVDDALAVAKEFQDAEEKLVRMQKSRVDLLNEAKEGECVNGCGGKWLLAAQQLLEANSIPVQSFCHAVYIALEKGRGKYQNIFIYGPANCGKTFILLPLKSIYKAFCNPATGTFAWMGADEAEIIYLNDFRWSATVIAWADLLQALEGDLVHLPAPKNFCRRDLELSADTPFFAMSDAPLVLIKGGNIDHTNTEMMNVRWKFFKFCKPIPEASQVKFEPCGHCFANFILSNKD